MSLKISNKLTNEWFTSPSDESKEAQFKIKPLSTSQMFDIGGLQATNMTGQAIILACKYGIEDFKGFKDEQGNEVPYSSTLIEYLPKQALLEVFSRIMEISQLTDTERKN